MAGVKDTNYRAGASDIVKNRLLMPDSAGSGMRYLIHADGSTSDPIAVATRDVDVSKDPLSEMEYELLELGAIYELEAGEDIHSAVNKRLVPTTAGRVIERSGAGFWYFRSVDLDGTASGKAISAIYVGCHYTAS